MRCCAIVFRLAILLTSELLEGADRSAGLAGRESRIGREDILVGAVRCSVSGLPELRYGGAYCVILLFL